MIQWSFLWPNLVLEAISLTVLVIVAVTVSSVRHEPDPRGHRLSAAYLGIVMFVSLFTALLAATAGVASLASLADDTPSAPGSPFEDPGSFDDGFDEDDEDADEDEGNEDEVGSAVQAFLLAGVAAGVLLYHRRRMRQLVDDNDDEEPGGGTTGRVVRGYLYASQAVALFTLVIGASIGLYGFAQVVVPEALSQQEVEDTRDDGAREVFTGGFLAVASLGIVRLHQDERDRLDGLADDGEDDDEAEFPPDQDNGEYPIA